MKTKLRIQNATGHIGAILAGMVTLQLICGAIEYRSLAYIPAAILLGWLAYRLGCMGERAAARLHMTYLCAMRALREAVRNDNAV